jgi:hypothetical protein
VLFIETNFNLQRRLADHFFGKAVTNPRLFATPYRTTQPKLFALDALGESGWLKALSLAGYPARARRRPEALHQALFPYLEPL